MASRDEERARAAQAAVPQAAASPVVRPQVRAPSAASQVPSMVQRAGVSTAQQQSPVMRTAGPARAVPPPGGPYGAPGVNAYTYNMYGPGSGWSPVPRQIQSGEYAKTREDKMKRDAQMRALRASITGNYKAPTVDLKEGAGNVYKNETGGNVNVRYGNGYETEIKPDQTAVQQPDQYHSAAEARADGAHFYMDPETGQLKSVDQYYYEHPEEA